MTAKINSVTNVRKEGTDDTALIVSCNITDFTGQTYDCEYCTRPASDNFPGSMNTLFQTWLAKNKGRYTIDEPQIPRRDRVIVPEKISDRQFFQQLAVDGLITEDEALAAVRAGELPTAFAQFIALLPDGEKFSAKMLMSGASEFERRHPLVAQFGEMQGLSPIELDDLWIKASLLK